MVWNSPAESKHEIWKVAIVLLAFVIGPLPGNTAEMDASQFIASFKTFIESNDAGANVRWNSPASPWFHYLGMQFQLGLNPAQRSEALRDGKQWRCEGPADCGSGSVSSRFIPNSERSSTTRPCSPISIRWWCRIIPGPIAGARRSPASMGLAQAG